MKKLILLALCVVQHNIAQPFDFKWGLSARQGDRESMEDTHAIKQSLNHHKRDAFFAVYDGHGGKQAANIAAEELHQHIPEHCDIPKALEEAFLITDKVIQEKTNAGTCAVVTYIKNNDAYFAWVGDSRAVLARNGNVIYATRDHKPGDSQEKMRIEAAGGSVTYHRMGVARVWGGLAVARALGDRLDKEGLPAAIIACPDIHQEKIQTDDVIILACDGVWDVMSNQEAVDVVTRAMQKPDEELEARFPAKPLLRGYSIEDPYMHLALVARALRDMAYKKGSRDNISVMVIKCKKNNVLPSCEPEL
jgi:serine/threonine protein phosphatase PrpC